MSAKACLTSAAIWRISMNSTFMSVNHFPYLPIVTNPETIPVSRRWTRSPPKCNHLLTGPLSTFPENFMQIRSEVFVHNCQQSNEQRRKHMAEVININKLGYCQLFISTTKAGTNRTCTSQRLFVLLFMAALCNRAGHFLPVISFYLLFFLA